MNIKELKKELGLKDKDLAGFFGLKHRSYSESSAKKRYEQAFINIYNFLEKKGEGEKNNKLIVSDSVIELDGKIIPVKINVSKYKPKIVIDFSNGC